MSWNYQLQDKTKIRFTARTKLMQIIRQDIPEKQIRAYNSPKSTWTVHGGRQETNAKYKYKDKKQFNRAKSGWTTKDKDDKRQIQNTKTKKQFIYAKSGWTTKDNYNQRHMQNTKTKHLCKEWVHDRMQSQRRKKSQCAGLTRSGWTSTEPSSPCPACPTSAPSSFSFSTLPRCSFISIAATQTFISP